MRQGMNQALVILNQKTEHYHDFSIDDRCCTCGRHHFMQQSKGEEACSNAGYTVVDSTLQLVLERQRWTIRGFHGIESVCIRAAQLALSALVICRGEQVRMSITELNLCVLTSTLRKLRLLTYSSSLDEVD